MRCKKIAAVLAAAALMTALSVSAKAPYQDISSLADRSAVDYLYDNRCLNFVTTSDFLPSQIMTRSETAQLFYDSMANFQQSAAVYKDIVTQKEQDAITAVMKRGIMPAFDDGSFHAKDLVTREDFAVMVYNYLKYYHLSDTDSVVPAYADESAISPKARVAVQVLRSKNIMVQSNGMFQPQLGLSRSEAVGTMYQLLKSDNRYVSHVAVESAVLKAIAAEYGSPQAYFNTGTLFWEGDTLYLGMKGGASQRFTARLKEDVHPADAVVIRHAKFSRADYDLIMNRAIRTLVKAEGIQNYIGSMPDYSKEQVILLVRRPVEASVQNQLNTELGAGVVRIESTTAPTRPASAKLEPAKTEFVKTEPVKLEAVKPVAVPAGAVSTTTVQPVASQAVVAQPVAVQSVSIPAAPVKTVPAKRVVMKAVVEKPIINTVALSE